jgi:tRNA A-37 threonylcarbamoyl transferase component Bud32
VVDEFISLRQKLGLKTAHIPALPERDVPILLAALLSSSGRVQPVALSSGTVWIKRHDVKGGPRFAAVQRALAGLLRMPFLRPSPVPEKGDYAARDMRRMQRFRQHGIPTADILYASGSALVFSDVGRTVHKQLAGLDDPKMHDDLLVFCCAELGHLHASGLCHGRPFPRDMFTRGGRIGFIDFEEEPEAVMPLEVAQARDIWLLFMQVASRAKLGRETHDRAYFAWAQAAPAAARQELAKLTGFLGGFLWLARLIGRVHMGRDLRQFIQATTTLTNILNGTLNG